MRYSQFVLFVIVTCCIFSQAGLSQFPSMVPMIYGRRDPDNAKLAKADAERIAELRSINRSDIEAYRGFLKNKHTGIFKLFPNMDCFSKEIIRIDGDCAGVVPDNSDFSFLQRDYEIKFHDIEFFKDEIVSHGFFSQGMLVSLKDTPIEDVTADRDELKFLSSIEPSHTFAEARKTALEFDGGVINNGNSYASHIKAAENTTYGLRLIAYEVPDNAFFANSSKRRKAAANWLFEELPRADLMVVFRVIRRDRDGVLVIVWKELDRQKAPRIKFAKGEEVRDFRTEQK